MKTFNLVLVLAATVVLAACAGSSGGGASGGVVPAGTTSFVVTAPSAPSSYNISGTENATLTLQRGQTYTFDLSVSGHPFYIMSSQGTNTANAYASGVTGNGTQNGTLTFVVPMNAPNTLFYDCSIHNGMTGTINITN